MIIDCISDLHGHYPKLEGGDLLIVAGDLTARDEEMEYFKLFQKLSYENYKKIIVIAGNHDNCLQKDDYTISFAIDNQEIFEYLCDSGTEFEYEVEIEEEHKFKGLIKYKVKRKLKIWGSPWTPWFHGVNPKCKAFMISESKLKAKWALIPDDIDILITHGPPYGKLDKTDWGHCGSITLDERVKQIRPKFHIFGHIHEGYHEYGGTLVDGGPLVQYFNVSHVNEHYQPVNKPLRVIIND